MMTNQARCSGIRKVFNSISSMNKLISSFWKRTLEGRVTINGLHTQKKKLFFMLFIWSYQKGLSNQLATLSGFINFSWSKALELEEVDDMYALTSTEPRNLEAINASS